MQDGEPCANTLPDEDARLHFQAVQALEKLYSLKPDHLESLIVGAPQPCLCILCGPTLQGMPISFQLPCREHLESLFWVAMLHWCFALIWSARYSLYEDNGTLSCFFHTAGVKDLMLESLLNPRHEMVRGVTAGLLRQIARSPGGHLAALHLLDGGMAAAEKAPHHCTEFFKLLSDLLSSMASAPPEVRHVLHHVKVLLLPFKAL